MVERSVCRSTNDENPLHYIHKYPHRNQQRLDIDYQAFLQLLEQAQEHDCFARCTSVLNGRDAMQLANAKLGL